ncbi:hypothetical protein SaSA73_0560 [Streptococcus agalactiae]|nr:hypothetical protein SaSA30_0564 [Streptococcus agalactiae]AUO81749.1 hypothetical protein SaSA33_0563 [Streptococcus agalactiae]AUO85034.1 hypothetical protein SaSA73_0560 [Streptococcus agalactiae]AUO86644.1 hypothetical protein SaSA1_0565 [Streptococcus agalactiae]AUO88298.1 hypothetical protein SaSA5_0563 [Streptococcus agalactiae]
MSWCTLDMFSLAKSTNVFPKNFQMHDFYRQIFLYFFNLLK